MDGRWWRSPWALLALLVAAPALAYGLPVLLQGAGPASTSTASSAASSSPLLAGAACEDAGGQRSRVPTASATLAPPLPPPRELDAMGYDPIDNSVVVFGGQSIGASGFDTVSFDDTWTLAADGWRLNHPTRSPVGLAGPIAEDPDTGDLIMVGGSGTATWRWDGAIWTCLEPSRPLRHPTGTGTAGASPPAGAHHRKPTGDRNPDLDVDRFDLVASPPDHRAPGGGGGPGALP